MKEKVQKILDILNGYQVSTAKEIINIAISKLDYNSVVKTKKEEK